MNKIFTSLLLILLLASCEKEEPEMVLIDNECSTIIRFNQKLEFLEKYGQSLTFKNIRTEEKKIFKYSVEESSATTFNDTILCTHLTYDEKSILKYIADDSNFISFDVNQYFDGIEDFNFFINNQVALLGGNLIDNRRFVIDSTYISFINDDDYIITYYNEYGLLLGYDDLNGNQWMLEDLSGQMFYCDVFDNVNRYKECIEYELYNKLTESPLLYTDGTSATITFRETMQTSNPGYRGIVANECLAEKLYINQSAGLGVNYTFGNNYFLSVSISSNYQSAQSEKKYSLIKIFMYSENVNRYLYEVSLVIDPFDLFDQTFFSSTPYTLHYSIELNKQEFNEVYEFKSGDESLFFNFDHGILAFTDHLGGINYLEVE